MTSVRQHTNQFEKIYSWSRRSFPSVLAFFVVILITWRLGALQQREKHLDHNVKRVCVRATPSILNHRELLFQDIRDVVGYAVSNSHRVLAGSGKTHKNKSIMILLEKHKSTKTMILKECRPNTFGTTKNHDSKIMEAQNFRNNKNNNDSKQIEAQNLRENKTQNTP